MKQPFPLAPSFWQVLGSPSSFQPSPGTSALLTATGSLRPPLPTLQMDSQSLPLLRNEPDYSPLLGLVLNPKHLSYFTPSLLLLCVLVLPQSCFFFAISFIISSAAASPAGPPGFAVLCIPPRGAAALWSRNSPLAGAGREDNCGILGNTLCPELRPGRLRAFQRDAKETPLFRGGKERSCEELT